ncbi:hypothetical protein C0J52_06007 [Blattella germanica]|nr:hypothetical protein C0J52_06007 [Blattella germanica]
MATYNKAIKVTVDGPREPRSKTRHHQPFHPFHFGPRPFHFGNPLDPGQRVPDPLVGSLPFKLTVSEPQGRSSSDTTLGPISISVASHSGSSSGSSQHPPGAARSPPVERQGLLTTAPRPSTPREDTATPPPAPSSSSSTTSPLEPSGSSPPPIRFPATAHPHPQFHPLLHHHHHHPGGQPSAYFSSAAAAAAAASLFLNTPLLPPTSQWLYSQLYGTGPNPLHPHLHPHLHHLTPAHRPPLPLPLRRSPLPEVEEDSPEELVTSNATADEPRTPPTSPSKKVLQALKTATASPKSPPPSTTAEIAVPASTVTVSKATTRHSDSMTDQVSGDFYNLRKWVRKKNRVLYVNWYNRFTKKERPTIVKIHYITTATWSGLPDLVTLPHLTSIYRFLVSEVYANRLHTVTLLNEEIQYVTKFLAGLATTPQPPCPIPNSEIRLYFLENSGPTLHNNCNLKEDIVSERQVLAGKEKTNNEARETKNATKYEIERKFNVYLRHPLEERKEMVHGEEIRKKNGAHFISSEGYDNNGRQIHNIVILTTNHKLQRSTVVEVAGNAYNLGNSHNIKEGGDKDEEEEENKSEATKRLSSVGTELQVEVLNEICECWSERVGSNRMSNSQNICYVIGSKLPEFSTVSAVCDNDDGTDEEERAVEVLRKEGGREREGHEELPFKHLPRIGETRYSRVKFESLDEDVHWKERKLLKSMGVNPSTLERLSTCNQRQQNAMPKAADGEVPQHGATKNTSGGRMGDAGGGKFNSARRTLTTRKICISILVLSTHFPAMLGMGLSMRHVKIFAIGTRDKGAAQQCMECSSPCFFKLILSNLIRKGLIWLGTCQVGDAQKKRVSGRVGASSCGFVLRFVTRGVAA